MASTLSNQENELIIKKLTKELFEYKGFTDDLRKSERQKTAFLNSITTSLIFVNDNLEIQWANSAAADSVDVKLKDMIGRTCHNLRANSDKPCCGCPTKKAFKTGNTEQTIISTPDGKIWDEKSEPVFDENGKIAGVLEIAHNVTEKIRMERQLRQIQKMNAVAGLAGGIAHQFNNALVGIVGNIELLQITLPFEGKIKKYIESMKETVNRMASLTNQLLAYARGGKYQTQTILFNDFVKSILLQIQPDVDSRIQIKDSLFDDGHFVKVDPTQMQMAITAIISNAIEAIEDSGCIKIGIKVEEVSQELAANNPAIKAGRFACLFVEDDGRGMDPDILKRVFEPFFTTNFQGRGLSMAAVYGIVDNHDGWIAIGSGLGRGTMVRIYLPVIDTRYSNDDIDARIAMGNGTALLIENEEMMMDINFAMLENIGYKVLSARSGAEAKIIANTYDGNIDLAFLDMGLQDTKGKDLFLALKKARPNLNIIVLDCESTICSDQELVNMGARNFLTKPFTITQLKEKLIEALESKS